ncbi:hypothetical protein ACFL2P_03870 [Candidatus Moduliflexota bacterium]
MYIRKNEAKEERTRQKLDAGLMSEHFPAVSRIIVTMQYRKGGASSLRRTLNYYPTSYAFFRMSCLEGCPDGALDLTRVIRGMIRKQTKASKGSLKCENKDPAIEHSDIAYDIAIKYS